MPIYKENRANPNAIYFEESSLGWVYFEDKLVWQKETSTSEFIFTISIGDVTVTLPLVDGYSYNFSVDWGDGSPVSSVNSFGSINKSHIYSSGNYDIKISGTCQAFCTALDDGEGFYEYNENIYQYITSVTSWGDCDFRLLNFYGCSLMSSIPNSPMGGINDMESYAYLFCLTNVSIIPENIFENSANGLDFSYCFFGCPITNIPSGLLYNCTNATTFRGIFASTSVTIIPDGLLDYSMNLTDVIGMFHSSPISSIPDVLFSNCINIENMALCFAYTEISSIPVNLFSNNHKIVDMTGCFFYTNITTIPAYIFDSLINAIDFKWCFESTKITSIPTGLFANCIKAENFDGCFENNPSLITVGINVFQNTSANDFTNCFRNDSGITSSVPELWNEYPSAIHDECYKGCYGATNYASIPVDWK